MNLPRTLEPEVMDSLLDAQEYDAMDHAQVNRVFVEDLLATGLLGKGLLNLDDPSSEIEILDLGTGTALIPIELCRRFEDCRVMGADLSISMLDLARYNIEAAGLAQRIQLDHVDSKNLHYSDGRFVAVMSNSIIHHIPDPMEVVREAVRVLAPGGLVFFRDLLRPAREVDLEHLVQTYAGKENEHSQKMFRESLHAALTLDEIRAFVENAGFEPNGVQVTSDRHWTWVGTKQ